MKIQLTLVALASIALIGCNSEDRTELKQDAGKLANTAGEAADNAQLAGRVKADLANTKGINPNDVSVEANDGVVTIIGHVHTEEEKKQIMSTAENVKGVTSVVDQIEIVAH